MSRKYDDRTVLGALYPTDATTHVINIDSRFRTSPYSTTPDDFIIKLPRTYKNAIALTLSSVELPNTWFEFTAERANLSFQIGTSLPLTTVTIPEGNYVDTSTLCAVIQDLLPPGYTIGVPADSTTGYIVINKTNNAPFMLDFTTALTGTRPFDNGIGSSLGFIRSNYSGSSSYTGELIGDVIGNNYIFIAMDNYDGIETVSFADTSATAFAKIVVSSTKYSINYDDGSSLITRTIKFPSPQNIHTLHIRLLDSYGRKLRLLNNWSCTLELVEVLNTRLYNSYSHNIPS
jgi:hypothetical protein